MKRERTGQQLSHFILASFIVIQCGVMLLLIAQSFSASARTVILGSGIAMIGLGGVAIIGYVLLRASARF